MTGSIKKAGAGKTAGEYYLKKKYDELKVVEVDEVFADKFGVWCDPDGVYSDLIESGGSVEDDAFRKIIRGISPITGDKLVHNAGEDRQTGYDFTFSSPKSVSILWAMSNEKQRTVIEKAILDSVRDAMKKMNEYAGFTRCGAQGKDVIQGKYLSALFLDYTARPVDAKGDYLPEELEHLYLNESGRAEERPTFIDMQLHVHGFIPNTMLCEDGKYRAVNGPEMFAAQGVVFETFHASLAWRLKEMGLSIEKGDKEVAFRLKDIDKDVCDAFSGRSKLIEAKKAELGAAPDERIGQAMLEHIKTSTRGEHIDVSSRVINEHWLARGEVYGFGAKQAAAINLAAEAKRINGEPPQSKAPKTEDIQAVVDAILEHESVFTEHKIRAAVLGKFTGEASIEAIHAAVDDYCADHLIQLEKKAAKRTFTTIEMIEKEMAIVDMAKTGVHKRLFNDKLTEQVIEESIAAGRVPSEVQIEAVKHVCNNDDLVVVLEGRAGAGKSFTMNMVRETFERAGYTTYGTALGWNASGVLRHEGGVESIVALEPLTRRLEAGEIELDDKSVIIIDEAGQVGSRHLYTVLKYASEAGAKVVMTGDRKQIEAVAAGGPLRAVVDALEARHGEGRGSYEIEEVRRQVEEWDRAAGLKIAHGDAAGAIKDYKEKGRLAIEKTREEALKRVFSAYRDDFGTLNLKGEVCSQLMIAKTNADVDFLNAAARDLLKSKGLIQTGITVKSVVDGREPHDIELGVGDKIQFRKKANAKISALYDDKIVNRATGKILDIQQDNDEHIRVKVQLYAGDKLSDTIVEVSGKDFGCRKGAIPIDYGYALTPDSAQGQTMDKTYMMGLGIDAGRAYVSATRHRESCLIALDVTTAHAMASRNMDADTFQNRNVFDEEDALQVMVDQWSTRQYKTMATDYIKEHNRDSIAAQMKAVTAKLIEIKDKAIEKIKSAVSERGATQINRNRV